MNIKSDFEKDNKTCENREFVNSEKALLKRVLLILSLVFFVYSAIIYVYASHNASFAERYAMTISAGFRELLATISGIFPFSITETMIIVGIPAFVLLLVRALVLRFSYGKKDAVKLFWLRSVCIIMIAVSVFINTFGICYKRVPVSEQLGINTEDITAEDIYVTACIASDSLSVLCGEISRMSSGESIMPYSFDEMVEKICNGYNNVLSYMPEKVSVKPVSISELWAYTHISGMYFPFTGESNINVSYPDYIIAFTTAHELAHQFGFAGEDDANMLAFLACIYSEDSYLAYSAFLSAFECFIADMPSQMARQLSYTVDGRIKDELSAYFKFMDSHTNKTVTGLSGKVNDVYLKANGIEQGTANYRQVTKLIAGFFKKNYSKYFNN